MLDHVGNQQSDKNKNANGTGGAGGGQTSGEYAMGASSFLQDEDEDDTFVQSSN